VIAPIAIDVASLLTCADLRSHVVHTLFSVMPEQLERIRQQVASSATLLVLLSNALLSEPTALVTV
jgi:hypothetical protein